MFDDLRKHATTDDQGQTKPNQLPANEIQPDPFTRILQSAKLGIDQKPRGILDVDEIKLLEPDAVLDWPSDNEKRAANCDKAVQISKYLKAADFPIRDNLLNSARNSTPDWLKGDDDTGDLPSWLTASAGDKPFAEKGLPKASRNTLPDWMRDSRVVGDSPDWLAEAREVKKSFDPNETQKTTAVKRHTIRPLPNNVPAVKKIKRLTKFTSYLKNNKSIQAFLVLIFTIGFGNIITSLFPTILDNIVADIVYIALYKWLASIGYDAKDIFLHSKQ